MDYQTNLEIAQDDQRFPAYRVELRSPFDRKYVKSYDNLAQGANTAFAPQGGHNGLWTANQANRVGRQSMERYHGGAGVGAVGNSTNCNPVNSPTQQFPGCQLPQGYVSYANTPAAAHAGKTTTAACQTVQQQGPDLCSFAVEATGIFQDQFAAYPVPSQFQCTATQYQTQNNCPAGGGGGGGGSIPQCCLRDCSANEKEIQCESLQSQCASGKGDSTDPCGSFEGNKSSSPKCISCIKTHLNSLQNSGEKPLCSGWDSENCLNCLSAIMPNAQRGTLPANACP